jgi:hypothetical protein
MIQKTFLSVLQDQLVNTAMNIITVCSEDHIEPINALCGVMYNFFNLGYVYVLLCFKAKLSCPCNRP